MNPVSFSKESNEVDWERQLRNLLPREFLNLQIQKLELIRVNFSDTGTLALIKNSSRRVTEYLFRDKHGRAIYLRNRKFFKQFDSTSLLLWVGTDYLIINHIVINEWLENKVVNRIFFKTGDY